MFARTGIISGLVLLVSVGCGTAGSGGTGLNANLITREDIDEVGPGTAYDIVQSLRPLWLEKRGVSSFYNEGEIRVYLDGSSLGGLDALRGLHSDNIESMTFLDERRASLRFGPGHENGVIHVITRR